MPVRQEETRNKFIGVLIGPVFLVLASWFVFGMDLQDIPPSEMNIVDAREITTNPLRIAMTDPPTTMMGGYDLTCRECHQLFASMPETTRKLTQHTNIRLDHGLNDRCFNCHDRKDRNLLTLPGNKTIPYREVATLCATCHGTTFRDWEQGMHGRTNGHWDPAYGEQRRLTCSECHDPHAPAFGQMTALPGPHTLRMGDQTRHPVDESKRKHNPLRKWQYQKLENHSDNGETNHESGEGSGGKP